MCKSLKTWTSRDFAFQGFSANKVEIKQVPCSIVSMSIFDRLKDPANNIVYESGRIRQRFDVEINGIMVSDNLRSVRHYVLKFKYNYLYLQSLIVILIIFFIFIRCL